MSMQDLTQDALSKPISIFPTNESVDRYNKDTVKLLPGKKKVIVHVFCNESMDWYNRDAVGRRRIAIER